MMEIISIYFSNENLDRRQQMSEREKKKNKNHVMVRPRWRLESIQIQLSMRTRFDGRMVLGRTVRQVGLFTYRDEKVGNRVETECITRAILDTFFRCFLYF